MKKEKFSFRKNIWLPFLQKAGIKDTRERDQINRIIYINNAKPTSYHGEVPLDYSNNKIVTSKYTLLNFLPKNIFEQFRRLANFYFLLIILIMFILPSPPRSPYVSGIPLMIVISISAIKQAYEDVLRHRIDGEVNKESERIIRSGKFMTIERKDIICGDIIEVKVDNSFPCDMLLLKSTSSECYITTANLDGETNLKIRSVPENLPLIKNENDLLNLRGVIKCDKPNTDLYEFKGKIEINNNEYPLKNENVLLRGSTLRVSSVIYGCAIYTGKDTKLMLNSKYKSNKMSCIERTMNRFILFSLALLGVYTLIGLIGSLVYQDVFYRHWYLNGIEPQFFYSNKVIYYTIEVLFFITMFSNIIPISMYIQIETQRFIGTKFFEWDMEMYDPVTNQPAKANNSNLNEDLGQIEFLFSDKTGTLTENEMIFKQFSLNNVIYEYKDRLVYELNSNKPVSLDTQELNRFFEILCLCHTVQLDNQATPRYQASSPDEFSFVQFCEEVGVSFEGDYKDESYTQVRKIDYLGDYRNYQLLHVLEFDSDRKRMSVIVRCLGSNRIRVLTKGAEDSVFNKCKIGNINEANEILKEFSRKGWRTLALAYRELSVTDYETFQVNLKNALNNLNDRDELLKLAYEQIEMDLILVGTTAVEDKLQEDVPTTLEAIRSAGIKVWVLTGDKRETAINISNSCKHFSEEMEKIYLTDMSSIENIKKALKNHYKIVRNSAEHKKFAYIVDGKTLQKVFKYELEFHFRNICMKCEAVLCCRMSPAQKAQVVQLVKKSDSKPKTCAIGDGANDVSMIQEAHVGLGIFGKEGRNAARSADFAFAKFKFIKRALLIHGYLFYTRLTTLVHYFFYKNLVLVSCHLYFAASNAFSIQSVFHNLILMFYNLFFTANPIFVFGLFEQRTSIKKLEVDPMCYKSIKNNKNLSFGQFLRWNISSIWHSFVAYISAFFLVGIAADGKLDGIIEFGSIVFLQVFFIVHLKLLIESRFINPFTALSNFNSFFALLILLIIPSSFIIPYPVTLFTENQNLFWIFYRILSQPATWLCFLVTCIGAILPDICYKTIEIMIFEFRQLSKKKFQEKCKCFRDLPENFEEIRRKRLDLKLRKENQYRKKSNTKIPKNGYATYKYDQ